MALFLIAATVQVCLHGQGIHAAPISISEESIGAVAAYTSTTQGHKETHPNATKANQVANSAEARQRRNADVESMLDLNLPSPYGKSADDWAKEVIMAVAADNCRRPWKAKDTVTGYNCRRSRERRWFGGPSQWVQSWWNHGSRAAKCDCPRGYSNIGVACVRDCSNMHVPQKISCDANQQCSRDAAACTASVVNQVLAVTEVLANFVPAAKAAKAAKKAKVVAFAKVLGRTYWNNLKENVMKYAAVNARFEPLLARGATLVGAGMVAKEMKKKTGDPQWEEIARDLDPTGISNLIAAFEMPMCDTIEKSLSWKNPKRPNMAMFGGK